MRKILDFFIKTAYAAETNEVTPMQGFRFTVSLEGAENMCFQKVDGLGEEIEVTEYNEGCRESTIKVPGRRKTTEVTLTRGIYTGGSNLEDIWTDFMAGGLRVPVTIRLLSAYNSNDGQEDGSNVARKWVLLNAWVSKWEGPSLDAGNTDVVVETLTIQYEGFDRSGTTR